MKSFAILAAFATSALAVFVSPADITAEKKYQLRDSTNNAHVLARCDGDILCVVNTGGDFVIETAVVSPSQVFTFPSGAAPTTVDRTSGESISLAVSNLSPSSNLAELEGGPNVRLRGTFTTNGSNDNLDLALAMVQSSNGLGVVLTTKDGSFVGVQDGQEVESDTPAAKVSTEYVWKLFEVEDATSDVPAKRMLKKRAVFTSN
ncbi:hypothetical protein DL96DRAFT_1561958 [Flagelloscypha sp. PMI_526]|nr:hypothetical protein DL96DRAFT_1561958 [Flagelloscypha sp. PMI_526]